MRLKMMLKNTTQRWLNGSEVGKLAFYDILQYQKIIVTLSETDRLMNENDKIEII
jgi:hypothetical protein